MDIGTGGKIVTTFLTIRNMLLSCALVAVAACSPGSVEHGGAHQAGTDPPPPAEMVREASRANEGADVIQDLGIDHARFPSEGLLTGGQITPEQMTALGGLGYTTFISLRPSDEEGAGWEEEYAAAGGIHFERIPIEGADGVTIGNAQLLADRLPPGDGRAVIYCASGNRVGALLAMKAHFVDGVDAGEALEFGLAGGLTRLEPAVREKLGLTTGHP